MAGQPEVIRNMVRSINTSLKEGKLVPDVPIGLQALFPLVGTALYDLMVYV